MFLFCKLFSKKSDCFFRRDIDVLVDELLNIESNS